jgi:hypothetical protein
MAKPILDKKWLARTMKKLHALYPDLGEILAKAEAKKKRAAR